MNKFGKRNQFEAGTMMAFACNCRCTCFCLTCNNCTSVNQATGLQYLDSANDMTSYNKSFQPATLMGF